MIIKRSSFVFHKYYLFSTAKAARNSKSDKNYYQLLELPSSATQKNIRKNYLRLAKIYHPDVYKGSDENRFDKVKEAYDTLSDSAKKMEYDQKIGVAK